MRCSVFTREAFLGPRDRSEGSYYYHGLLGHGADATQVSAARRTRRLEGQVRGLQKILEENRYCPEIMSQISAAQEALSAVGRELVRNRLRH